MKYLSVKDFASKYGVSERTIRNYCVSGKIEGAFLTGKTWNIPEDANLPQKGKHSVKETTRFFLNSRIFTIMNRKKNSFSS